jgi:hypothetical protein
MYIIIHTYIHIAPERKKSAADVERKKGKVIDGRVERGIEETSGKKRKEKVDTLHIAVGTVYRVFYMQVQRNPLLIIENRSA